MINFEEIKKRRILLGFTQEELAEKAGKGQDYISRIESGTLYNLYMESIRDIADALGCSIKDIIY